METVEDDAMSMASIVKQMDDEDRGVVEPARRTPQRGEIVDGIISSVDRDGILIDVGTKSEGEIPEQEVAELMASDNPPKVGDAVLAFVLAPRNREGRYLLSLTRGRVERSWRELENAGRAGLTVSAPVIDANRGGLVVDLNGVRGFVPMSQIHSIRLGGANEAEVQERLKSVVGQTLALKIVEVNQRRARLILSERQAAIEQRGARKAALVDELREGEVRKGRVTSLTDFGAFVDIGGADGLVHLSELSWNRVNKASDVVNVGDEIDVMVLNVDHARRKIGLSLRRTQPEPWALAIQNIHPGDIVEGTITKLATFGAFARLEEGIEGLIHISELSDGHVSSPRAVVQEGERRRMRVLRVDAERRRMGLSLKGVPPLDEEGVEVVDEEPDYSAGYSTSSEGTTIGDAIRWKREN